MASHNELSIEHISPGKWFCLAVQKWNQYYMSFLQFPRENNSDLVGILVGKAGEAMTSGT